MKRPGKAPGLFHVMRGFLADTIRRWPRSGGADLFHGPSDKGLFIHADDQLPVRRLADDKTLNRHAGANGNGAKHLILPQEAKLDPEYQEFDG